MTQSILFVDDEPSVLDGIRRTFARKFTVTLARGPNEGLRSLNEQGPFAVAISDMRMPGMSGTEFLAQVRRRSPDTVRMILSGQADLEATIAAVNEGNVFRFLTKPCTPESLASAISCGLEQYRLIRAEKELLEQTLAGAVQLLTDILATADPEAYGQASRIARYAEAMADALQIPNKWEVRLAGLLSQIGCVALPRELMAKARAGETLNSVERGAFEGRDRVAAKLIANIPRLQQVAEIIVDAPAGTPPVDASSPDRLRIARLILQAATGLEAALARGEQWRPALTRIAADLPDLPRAAVDALGALEAPSDQIVRKVVPVKQLVAGMILDEDVVSKKGVRLVCQGQEVTATLVERLRGLADSYAINEPVRVHMGPIRPSGPGDRESASR